MNHIVFYVHRTGLLSYFINPICAYLSKDYEIIILHVDKKNGYNYAPKDSVLYRLIDLSDKNVWEIQKLISELQPKAFISLGFISIYELLILRICKSLGIKTIFLEHGLYSKETSTLPFGKLIHKFGCTVSKNLYFLGRYWQFIWLSKNSRQEALIFWRCFRKKQYYMSKFDKALFFADYGYRKITEMFRYEDDEVDFMGYPLAKTNKEFEEYQRLSSIPNSKNGLATFIHQPFILDGLANWSYEDEREYFLQLAKSLEVYGYKLSIQLHPRESFERYQQLYKDSGIDIVLGMDRADFKKYSLVVGSYSTALLYPIYFKIPVMIVGYPKVCEAKDSVFFPICCSLPIKDEKEVIKTYDDFCKEYLGSGMLSFENISNKLRIVIA